MGIGFLVVAGGIEAICLQATGRVQNEDLEHGFAKAKEVRSMAFTQGADQQIQLFDISGLVTVYLFEFAHRVRVVVQIFKGSDWVES